MKAHRYACNITDDGQIEKGMMVVKDVPSQQVENRLRDLMNQMIIVGNVENGYDYYKSKNGTMIKVNNAGQKNLMTVSGGFQLEHNTPIKVDSIYDLSETGNGKSYSMSNQHRSRYTRHCRSIPSIQSSSNSSSPQRRWTTRISYCPTQ